MTDYELKQEAVVRSRSPAFLFSLFAAIAIAAVVVGWFVLADRKGEATGMDVSATLGTATTPASSATSTTPVAASNAPVPAVSTETASQPPVTAATNAPVPAVETQVPAATPPAANPAPAAPSPAEGVAAELARLKAADQLTEARTKGVDALKQTTDPASRRAIEDLLSTITGPLLLSKRPMPEKMDYTVVAGDSLDKLARRFGTTVDLIRKANGLPGQVIRLGTRLRILQARLAIVVDKSENTLVLTLNDSFLKRYHVGTGQYSTTPTGTFKITGKVAQPTWYHPDGRVIPYGDKENLLGTHWMSIDVPGFGIHGTWDPASIGRQSSQGCVRLVNPDIEELFTIVPEGTPVVIQD